MKNSKIRIVLYVLAIIVGIAAVQFKKALVVKDRAKAVVSLPSEIKKYGTPVDVESVAPSDLKKSVRVTMSPVSDKYAEFYFSRKEASLFKVGQEVYSIQDRNLIGKIVSISFRGNDGAGLYSGKVLISSPSKEPAVDVVIHKVKNKLSVPEDAVDSFREKDKNFLWVDQDGAAHLQEVKVGERGSGRIEITDGVQEGMLVVVNGWKNLEQGKKLRVRNCYVCDAETAGEIQ